jgi:hypothetical protein
MTKQTTKLETIVTLPTLALSQLFDGGEHSTAVSRNDVKEIARCPKTGLWLIQAFPAWIKGRANSFLLTLTNDDIDDAIKDMIWANLPTLKPSATWFITFLEFQRSKLDKADQAEFDNSVFGSVLLGTLDEKSQKRTKVSGAQLRWVQGFFGKLADDLVNLGEIDSDNLETWFNVFADYATLAESQLQVASDLSQALKSWDRVNNPEGSASRVDDETSAQLQVIWTATVEPAIKDMLTQVNRNFGHVNYALREFMPVTKNALGFPNKRTGANMPPKKSEKNAPEQITSADVESVEGEASEMVEGEQN